MTELEWAALSQRLRACIADLRSKSGRVAPPGWGVRVAPGADLVACACGRFYFRRFSYKRLGEL